VQEIKKLFENVLAGNSPEEILFFYGNIFAEFSFHGAALQMIDGVDDVADIPRLSS